MKTNTSWKFIGILLLIALSFGSCTVQKEIPSDYFQKQRKVGVIYRIDTINSYKEGGQGILDVALTSQSKYKKPLTIVDKKINPTKKIKQLYKDAFASQKIELVEIDFQYNTKELTKFQKPKTSKKIYHKYNLKSLKKSKGIDDLLIVNVNYGLLVGYYAMIETGRAGYCKIMSELVNLTNNSVTFRNISTGQPILKEKWKTPPNYENLAKIIEQAIQETLDKEKAQFEKNTNTTLK